MLSRIPRTTVLGTGTTVVRPVSALRSEMTHRAFSVIKREGQEDYWLPVGAAFEHADECIRFLHMVDGQRDKKTIAF